MGFLSSLFGGGDTNVRQASTNKTDVNVTNQIGIDTDLFAQALTSVGEGFTKAQQQVAAALLLAAGLDAQADQRRLNLVKKALKWGGAAFGTYLVWRNRRKIADFFKPRKKRKSKKGRKK